ncbi:MAG TPA: polysaccharide biosynthesis/export family protein [Syntrophorhabdaceae bacterium]|nr:polysaccharide biosynthesis/export family protein [Syntrophorhabdaceae bacterium]
MKKNNIYMVTGLLIGLLLLVPMVRAEGVQTTPKDAQAGKASDAYILGPGDALDISLWRDDALTKQNIIILPDGRISFPLAGEIMAAGKTVDELKKDIAEKLIDYVPEPVLSVEVRQANSMLIYVIGRVNTPNRFPVNANVNVLQGLAMAGGLNPFAKRNDIKIFRQEEKKTKIFPFRYDDVVEGRNLEENIVLQRGDVIVVP